MQYTEARIRNKFSFMKISSPTVVWQFYFSCPRGTSQAYTNISAYGDILAGVTCVPVCLCTPVCK